MKIEDMQEILGQLYPKTLTGTLRDRSQNTVLVLMIEQVIKHSQNAIPYQLIYSLFAETDYKHFRINEILNELIHKRFIEVDDITNHPLIYDVHYRLNWGAPLLSIGENKPKSFPVAFQRYLLKAQKAMDQANMLTDVQKLVLNSLFLELLAGNEEFNDLSTFIAHIQSLVPRLSSDEIRFALRKLVYDWAIECDMTNKNEPKYRFLKEYEHCEQCNDILLPTEYFVCSDCEKQEFDATQKLEMAQEMLLDFLQNCDMPLDILMDCVFNISVEKAVDIIEKLERVYTSNQCEECHKPIDQKYFKIAYDEMEEEADLQINIYCHDCFEKNTQF